MQNNMSSDQMPSIDELRILLTDYLPEDQVYVMNRRRFYQSLSVPKQVFEGSQSTYGTPPLIRVVEHCELDSVVQRHQFLCWSSGACPRTVLSFPQVQQPVKPLTGLILLLAGLSMLSLMFL